MGTEIERRFLVTGDGWRASASRSEALRQGYVAKTPLGTVRVRIAERGATLTLKSERRGLVRDEFECAIAREDAEYILGRLCMTPVLEKVRYVVPHGDHVWSVDVYGGPASGLVIAEIELGHPDEAFGRPPWLGREITGHQAYRNSRLAQVVARSSKPAVSVAASRTA